MRYEEFLADYDRVYDGWAYGKVPAERVGQEVARLRGLIPQIDEVDRREWAEDLLSRWESEASGPARERRGRAHQVLAQASRPGGTDEERLARYRQGIADIASIAKEADTQDEQDSILEMNEMLSTLIQGIEYDRQHPAEP